ncbi:MAG: Gfo/Idh/MocA family oxidoreductase, partial [Candidatus Firestonebacteria bacterium]
TACKPEAAIIATPNSTHAELTIKCLKAGIKVLCEKPMANTIEEANAMLKAYKKYGGFLQIGFNLRYMFMMREMRKIIDAGIIGEVMHIHYLQTPGSRGRLWIVDKKKAGGLFYEKLCHQVDIFRYFMGDVKSVDVFAAPNVLPQYTINDNVYASYRMAKGKVGHISFFASLAAVVGLKEKDFPKYGHYNRYDIMGTKGSISHTHWDHTILVTRRKKVKDAMISAVYSKKVYSLKKYPDMDNYCKFEDLDFIHRVLHNKKEYTSPYDSLKTMKAVVASEKSAETGKRVTL